MGVYTEKKKIKFSSYLRKFPSHIWVNICAFPRILGSPYSYLTLQLLHSEFPYIWRKSDFLIYQCKATKTHEFISILRNSLSLEGLRNSTEGHEMRCIINIENWTQWLLGYPVFYFKHGYFQPGKQNTYFCIFIKHSLYCTVCSITNN